MFDAFLVLIFIAIIAITTGQNIFKNENSPGDDAFFPNEISRSYRQGKFFPFFSVVRFANSECTGSHTLSGTCFTKRECVNMKGVDSGSCANGLGVCCVFEKTCGSTTNINNTYFINSEYPTRYLGGEQCSISVSRCNSNICQLRIDFIDLRLAQPNANGTCDKDVVLISGGSSKVPRLCGENTNQHVYVDFNADNPITISIHTNADFSFDDRRWNFKIQQIACDSSLRAPSGCLQYYTGISDTIMSFNYGSLVNTRAQSVGSRQMANLMYGVCIRMALGYCSIEWSESKTNSFLVTGNLGAIPVNDPDPNVGAESGSDCDKDFVIVPNPYDETGTALKADRFCGTKFVTKSSSLKPFALYVVTNDNFMGKVQSKGFSLNYKQQTCAV
ncbi:uncharacterized protein LOC122497969 [Leptopilina heterotoma]|uniref:uncharacterized protein LOC122497969 n=1 Tax=Leptopilina heterotoma TaxID=63436 RepID=UPI001CA8FFAB|nr:uncharacterized protein LOC122497969 [Leptopilina heterotoma]